VKLLRYAATQPWGTQFVNTLPLGGVDGSIGYRFRGTAAEGQVQAKTGSLGHVNALSGFATTIHGDRVVFAIIGNNHNLGNRRALQLIDGIVNAIVDDSPPKKK
jgi:D-alanyl-D-alanine carboxypeptidase/D-alanyl-D-alanine-endopeptidase (penicillin-binding protein 4)